MTVQGAEIDGKIADIARTYFGLPEEVEVAVADGRAYLTASEEKFDVIMVDAYQDITIPFQLSSRVLRGGGGAPEAGGRHGGEFEYDLPGGWLHQPVPL